MRFVFALILMFVIPLQFTWSAVAAIHGHAGDNKVAMGKHHHEHNDDQIAGHGAPDPSSTVDQDPNHDEDGHHAGHYHPTFNSILAESGLMLGPSMSAAPPPHPPARFTSRTPPLFDRPPLASA